MPSTVEHLYREHQLHGLVVLSINMGERRAAVASWARRHALTVPILLDEDREVTRRYGVVATPTVFLIDREGLVVVKAEGPSAWETAEGQQLVETLLAMTARP